MGSWLVYLLKGMTLGMGVAIVPGPMSLLVVTQTMRFGLREGVRVALIPLIAEMPIVFGACLIVSKLSRFDLLIALISIAGAAFLGQMAISNWNAELPSEDSFAKSRQEPGSIYKCILTIYLSPYPYLFWLTVGAPLVNSAAVQERFAPIVFVAGMYSVLGVAMMAVAWMAQRLGMGFMGTRYRLLLRATSIALGFFMVIFLREGFQRMGM